MNFEDEEYVRLYSRDTITMKKIGWEGRTVLWHIMRKVESSGVLELTEGDDPAEAVAVLCDLPEELARIGLERLASRGVTERHGASIVLTRFVEAQNAKRSDRLRAQDYRDRQRTKNNVEIATSSRGVTERHDSSLPASPLPPHSPALPSPALPGHASPESRPGLSSARRCELSFQAPDPEDIKVIQSWCARFERDDVNFTAERALPLRERRADGASLLDALDAVEGAAADSWFRKQGAKFSLIFNQQERFEVYRDAGRALRAGSTPKPLDPSLPLVERARLALADDGSGPAALPESWPELRGVADSFARAAGHRRPRLGNAKTDVGARLLLRHVADGWPVVELTELAAVIGAGAKREGRNLGIASLTDESLRRAQNERPQRAEHVDPDTAREITRTKALLAGIGNGGA